MSTRTITVDQLQALEEALKAGLQLFALGERYACAPHEGALGVLGRADLRPQRDALHQQIQQQLAAVQALLSEAPIPRMGGERGPAPVLQRPVPPPAPPARDKSLYMSGADFLKGATPDSTMAEVSRKLAAEAADRVPGPSREDQAWSELGGQVVGGESKEKP